MAHQRIREKASKYQPTNFNKNTGTDVKKSSTDYSGFFLPAILILTAFVFANTLSNDFVNNWDDDVNILDNEIIKSLSWTNLKEIFLSFRGTDFPLTNFSFAIEYKLFGLHPFYFHLTNLILHLLNTFFLFIFLKRFSGKIVVAAIATLFFAIHPMHVESVAWITERKDLLYTLFFLLSLNAYTKYLTTDKRKFYVWSLAWFLFSLLSKPAAASLPLVLVLMDYYYRKNNLWKNILSKAPFFVLIIFLGAVIFFFQKTFGSFLNLNGTYNILDRIFLVSYSAVYYLVMLFAPVKLSVLHYFPAKSNGMLPSEYYLSAAALVIILWLIIKSVRLNREIIFGFLFYFVTIAMVLQVVPFGISIVAERYSYVPYIGLFFIIGHFFSAVMNNEYSFGKATKNFISLLLILFAVVFSFISYGRNKVWKNGITLATDVIKKTPSGTLGWYARARSEIKKKDYTAALADLNRSILLDSSAAERYFDRGMVNVNLNNFEEAIADFNKSVSLDSTLSSTYSNRAIAYSSAGKFAEAIKDCNKAIQLKPDYYEAYSSRALAFENLNRTEEALQDFNKAIGLQPENPEAYFNRGTLYTATARFDSAISDYNTAIRLKPDYVEAFCNRGASFARTNRMKESLADFNAAIVINPNFPEAYFSRGFTKLSLNDRNGACSDWQKASQLGYGQANDPLKNYCQ